MTESRPQPAGLADEANWSLLDTVLQGSPVATFVINSDHLVTHWNRACELITGIPASQIIGTSEQWRGFYPERRPVLADLIVSGKIDQALATYKAGDCHRSSIVEGAYEAEGYFPLVSNGSGRWLYFTAAPVLDQSGRVIGAIETLQDISERKKAEMALQAERDNLEALVTERTAELSQRNTELLELTQERGQLEERVTFASNTALTAMSSMGEMGILLQSLQRYNDCRQVSDVAKAAIAGLASYDLIGTVQIRTDSGNIQDSTTPEYTAHDSAIFSRLTDMGRLVHFHSRMIINYPRVSLIIHNVPKDDPEKVGRIRDNVAILVEAADVRVAALLAESGTVTRQDAIIQTIEKIGGMLSNIKQNQQKSLADSSMAIHEMTRQLEKLFVHLGLTDNQEEMLLDLINRSMEDIAVAQSGQLDFQKELASIIHMLEEVAGHRPFPA